ncbi:hypothetical protein DMP15_28985 [Pseudonocardia sp. UM4_GMWB1]
MTVEHACVMPNSVTCSGADAEMARSPEVASCPNFTDWSPLAAAPAAAGAAFASPEAAAGACSSPPPPVAIAMTTIATRIPRVTLSPVRFFFGAGGGICGAWLYCGYWPCGGG